jgi:hypothetical protein
MSFAGRNSVFTCDMCWVCVMFALLLLLGGNGSISLTPLNPIQSFYLAVLLAQPKFTFNDLRTFYE